MGSGCSCASDVAASEHPHQRRPSLERAPTRAAPTTAPPQDLERRVAELEAAEPEDADPSLLPGTAVDSGEQKQAAAAGKKPAPKLGWSVVSNQHRSAICGFCGGRSCKREDPTKQIGYRPFP
jgi:hypothetical protein